MWEKTIAMVAAEAAIMWRKRSHQLQVLFVVKKAVAGVAAETKWLWRKQGQQMQASEKTIVGEAAKANMFWEKSRPLAASVICCGENDCRGGS